MLLTCRDVDKKELKNEGIFSKKENLQYFFQNEIGLYYSKFDDFYNKY